MGAAGTVLFSPSEWVWKSSFLLGDSHIALRVDAVSAFFLLLLGMVGSAGTVYGQGYWSDTRHPHSSVRGRFWWGAMLVGMASVLVAANGLHFLLAWEVFAVSAYFLITLERNDPNVRQAGWLYLAASHAGTLTLFAFFASLAACTGTWDLQSMTDVPELAPLFWLALLGFGIKAGIFSLHIWLPSAHANAPSHVSALLSGVALKIGIYGILRFSGWIPLPAGAGWVIAGAGCASSVLGVAFALGQHDLKRLLAYHSVENIGIILMGIGFGIIALEHGMPQWGVLALAGGLLHVWNHGLFKALLFLGAGAVLHGTGTGTMSLLGGLWRRMPWTAGLFALGSMAICGLPPLNGFVSEWLLYSGFLTAGVSTSELSLGAMMAALFLSVTGGLALACFTKVCGVVFLGAPRTGHAESAHECTWSMRGAMLGLAMACAALGLFPAMVWPILTTMISTWADRTLLADPNVLGTLGRAHQLLAVGMLGLIMAALLALAGRARRALTWDCGFSAPTTRMQYTAGSFARILTTWFTHVLRPESHELHPTTFFPDKACDTSHTPETILKHVMEPMGRIVLAVADWASGFQHGRVQSYISYVFAALLALAAAVALSPTPQP